VALGRWRCWRNCTEKAYALNKSRMVPIAEYSRDCLKALRAETGIAYDDRAQGTLQLFRTQKQLDGIGGDVEVLKQYGVPFEVLDRAGFVKVEPALALRRRSSSARCACPATRPATASFTNRLAEMAAARREVPLRHHGRGPADRVGKRIDGCAHQCRPLKADRYVLALGSHSPKPGCAAGHPHPGLPGQGLLDHGADHRPGGRARVDHHGRDAQGGGDAPGRPHPRRRHGRAGRLQPELREPRRARWSTW
jgi:D-amino-acid dehydrogenase